MLWLLRDRPAMAQYPHGNEMRLVSQSDDIWQWAAGRFAGRGTGFWIGWGQDDPDGKFEADHFYGWDRGWIRLRELDSASSGSGSAFERLWFWLVFEFFNQENAAGFARLYQSATKGRISKDDFITGYAKLEYEALRKVQGFYKSVWVPWCRKSGFMSAPAIWRHNYVARFEDWIARYPRSSEYPWKYYGAYYDALPRAEVKK